jgi:hypothetical protein
MQMLTNPVKGLLLISSIVVATPAIAGLKPGSFITKDGAQITPTLTTGISSNDNFFSTPNDEESRLIWTISPNVDALIEDGVNYYNLNVSTRTKLHNKDSADNFTQVNFKLSTHNEFSSKHRLDTSATLDNLYEPRGSGLTEGLGAVVDELVEYDAHNINARYEYGAQSSKAQVAFVGGFFNKKYQNFRAISQFRNFDKTLIGVIGYYNTQSASRVFVELMRESYRYDVLQPGGISRDSTDIKILTGMEWEATAVTSGTVKFGYQKKAFESQLRDDFNGLSWEAAVNWQPLSYSTLQLSTSRAAKDPLVEGDYIKESRYGVNWSHDWSDYLGSLVSASFTNEKYTGSIGRKDETKNLRLGLNYVASNFGLVSTYVDLIDKNSTQDTIEFDRVVVGINFTFALKAN